MFHLEYGVEGYPALDSAAGVVRSTYKDCYRYALFVLVPS